MLKAKLVPYGYDYSTEGLTLKQKIYDLIDYYRAIGGRTIMKIDEQLPISHEDQFNYHEMVRLHLYGIKEQDPFHPGSIRLKQITQEALNRVFLTK